MALNKHEENVSEFYSKIVDFKHDYNEGFLTFGLWKTKSGDPIPPPLSYQRIYDELLEGSTIKPDHNVLDVACGQGAGMLRIQSKYGCKIQGIDISTGNVELAKRRLRDTAIAITHGSATNMPYRDNSFDCIVCVEGGPHFKTKEDFFAEAYRLLKPGGKLLLADVAALRPMHDLSYLQQAIFTCITNLWVIPHENTEYGIETYKQKLKNIGFQISKFEFVGERVFPGYCSHNLTLSVMRAQAKVRGNFVGFLAGPLIDSFLKIGYSKGLYEYLFVAAEKTC